MLSQTTGPAAQVFAPPRLPNLNVEISRAVNRTFNQILTESAEAGLAKFLDRIGRDLSRYDDGLLDDYLEWRLIEYRGTELPYDADEQELYRQLRNLSESARRRLSLAILPGVLGTCNKLTQ
jgi:hypothetical protein